MLDLCFAPRNETTPKRRINNKTKRATSLQPSLHTSLLNNLKQEVGLKQE